MKQLYHRSQEKSNSIIDSLSRLFLPDIQAFFETEEGLKAYEEWKEEKK